MDQYFAFLDGQEDVHPFSAPALLVEEFGIEYRKAVEIVTEWVRISRNRSRYVN